MVDNWMADKDNLMVVEDNWMMVKLELMNQIDRNKLKNRMLDLDKRVVESTMKMMVERMMMRMMVERMMMMKMKMMVERMMMKMKMMVERMMMMMMTTLMIEKYFV
jgi:hypothetical protein